MEDKSPSGVTKRNDGGEKNKQKKKTKQQQRSGRCLQTRLNESPSTHKKKGTSYDSDQEEAGLAGWQAPLHVC